MRTRIEDREFEGLFFLSKSGFAEATVDVSHADERSFSSYKCDISLEIQSSKPLIDLTLISLLLLCVTL